ncbi:flavodoxin domain-containing protein [Aureibacillus halotolerans]|uniref:Flavodoxin I n=1 Tax=Aureibacillus halotolerans TaxID=1508390 RepID=A0A4R6UCJ4_9BACI|nr:flavodoxin domain-containing protein [Aureibacillus halotolerans]TDQ42833.1 flavodoxin I [Aureibacillus halotolerans]
MKILVAYVSMSGSTEEISELIVEGIEAAGHSAERIHIEEEGLEAKALAAYDGILIGSYTYGNGDLPYEMDDFYDDLNDVELAHTTFAVFGSCDSAYEIYGGAVDTLEKKLIDCGSVQLQSSLKVELAPMGEEMEACRQYGRQFAERLHETKTTQQK